MANSQNSYALFVPNFMEQYKAVDVTMVQEPKEEIGSNDHVVGVLDDNLLRLQGLRIAAHEKLDAFKEVAAVHAAGHLLDRVIDPEECKNMHRKLKHLAREATKLKRLFWDDVNATFPELQNKNNIAVRKGFQVVWTDGPPEKDSDTETIVVSSLEEAAEKVGSMLRGLFGLTR
ncbi:MAG: hypothetical protein HY006_01475 [Candidatus Sungbacteria bacterium]|nr:hypothetical protein [Candidatus Sungbacteria bacterium]